MKYLRATFKGYIGFFNGMGLHEVDIDFTKCQHNIVLICGANGSGKSTVLDHLHVFPDSSSSFIPDKSAEKDLVLFDNGDTYTIQIISPADLKGRKTTKAYIQKNGVELNENGNVSSYKDIIFSEFELDSNYISLSAMSSMNRGLGDKTPAERKKFVSNIIDNLEVYNGIYKTLNKKSLIYKSHTNTLHTKIQNIGDKDMLEQRLSVLRARESELNTAIMNINNQIVAIQAKNSIDEDEAKVIQEATDNANRLSAELELIQVRLDSYANRTKINSDNIESKYLSDKELLATYQAKVDSLTDTFRSQNSRLSDISSSLLSIEAEISNNSTEDNISDRYADSNNKMKMYNDELKKLGVPNDTTLILTITNLISFCDKFSVMIDRFNDGLTPSDIKYLALEYKSTDIIDLIEQQKALLDQIDAMKESMVDIQSDIKALAILEDRPKTCKVDTCPFISDAIKVKKSIKQDPADQLSSLQASILELSDKCSELQSRIDILNSLVPKKMELDTIRSMILENKDGLSLFYPELLANYDNMIGNMNGFNTIKEHRVLTDGLNILKMLDAESRTNEILKTEYNGYREKIKLINSSKSMIEKLKKEQDELVINIGNTKSELDSYNSLLNNLRSNIGTELEYFNTITEYKNKKSEFDIANSKVEEYNKKSSKALEALSSINELRNGIEKYSNELKPIMQDINAISGQLTLLDSYYAEYAQYKQSYDVIETLKKYCSPTGGGIQTLFMQLYMSKTKDVSNSVLSMLFGGQYQLLDFIINESEFRIPFIGEGLPVDDISSGSSAQVSMMSMIINLALLHQASTKFNIVRMDECDSALDAYNNSQFVNVLFRCMEILKIEQLFLISHSTETDGSFADIIKLKWYDNFESDLSQSGNVIWDYNEVVKNK